MIYRVFGIILLISCNFVKCSNNAACVGNYACVTLNECAVATTTLFCGDSKFCCPNFTNNRIKPPTKKIKYEPFNTIGYHSQQPFETTTEYNHEEDHTLHLYTNRLSKTTTIRNVVKFNSNNVWNKFKPCGLTAINDKITGGQVAEFGQFPWMALLGFKISAGNMQFLCGGSLITRQHVLTAAHCLMENRQYELTHVRLGEFNLTTSRDCEQFGKEKFCSDPHRDVPVERVNIHSEYVKKTLKNDIAVIKLRFEIRETDYIRSVCLPFNRTFHSSDFIGRNFTVSGWGKSSSGDLFGSNVLQFAKVQIWNERKCNETIPPEVRPLDERQLCANGQNSEDACKGDSGGPLVNTTLDSDREIRSYQIGIVSFGTSTCGDRNLPTIYTKVDQYLNWILDKVQRD